MTSATRVTVRPSRSLWQPRLPRSLRVGYRQQHGDHFQSLPRLAAQRTRPGIFNALALEGMRTPVVCWASSLVLDKVPARLFDCWPADRLAGWLEGRRPGTKAGRQGGCQPDSHMSQPSAGEWLLEKEGTTRGLERQLFEAERLVQSCK